MTGQSYQFLSPLSDAEYDALRADIAANGMRHPLIVDERGKILDGHHRARVAAELGFKPEREVVEGLTEQEKRDLAFTLNSARRHMDQVQRRAAVIASLKADPQLSDRQHGRRTGVSHPTVAGIRAELVAAGRLESLTSRIGADGRERPATRPPTAADVRQIPSADGAEADGESRRPGPAGGCPVGQAAPAPAAAPVTTPGAAAGVTPKHPESRPGEAPAGPVSQPTFPRAAGEAPTGAPTPVGAGGPSFDEVLDRLVPDDNPHREWQGNFLKAISGVNRIMLFTPADVAEKADEQCIEELVRVADRLATWRAEVMQARKAAIPHNVTPIRRIS